MLTRKDIFILILVFIAVLTAFYMFPEKSRALQAIGYYAVGGGKITASNKSAVKAGGQLKTPLPLPTATGVKNIVYKDLQFNPDFSKYKIEKEDGSLLDEGLRRFAADWQKLLT